MRYLERDWNPAARQRDDHRPLPRQRRHLSRQLTPSITTIQKHHAWILALAGSYDIRRPPHAATRVYPHDRRPPARRRAVTRSRTGGASLSVGIAPRLEPRKRDRLIKRAKTLRRLSLAYMTVEGAVAITGAILASSVALLGFGLDSAIEGIASIIVIWRFTGSRRLSPRAEQHAQRLVAITFFLLASGGPVRRAQVEGVRFAADVADQAGGVDDVVETDDFTA